MSLHTVPLGILLKNKRQRQDMTLEAAAWDVGVSNSTFSLWENGKTVPSAKWVKPIAQFLEISERDAAWLWYKAHIRAGK